MKVSVKEKEHKMEVSLDKNEAITDRDTIGSNYLLYSTRNYRNQFSIIIYIMFESIQELVNKLPDDERENISD